MRHVPSPTDCPALSATLRDCSEDYCRARNASHGPQAILVLRRSLYLEYLS